MADFDIGAEVNAKKMQVYIGAVGGDGGEWKLMQNARVLISHPIFREPTTSGGVATYTGAPDNTISGTLLFTRDEWNRANAAGEAKASGFAALLTPDTDGGEVLTKSWVIKLTDIAGTATNATLTFTSCKLSVVDISISVEGAVKADITVICPGEPATTPTDQ